MREVDLGRIGIWSRELWGEPAAVADAAAELDELGYGALWLPNRPGIFERCRALLEAMPRAAVAPGIASIWSYPPAEAAGAHRSLTAAHPGRFLLGLGVSHARIVDRDQPGRYSRPLLRMREYLDALDSAPAPVPVAERALAALGPRMLELARERSAGAHPYLTTPDHTRSARAILGPDSLLAPEQAVVLISDPDRARSLARRHLAIYLLAPNYTNNWLRLGYGEEDFNSGGSDRLVDALIAWGPDAAIRDRITAHLEAGADHVCVQVLTDRDELPRAEWRELARRLDLRARTA